MRIVLTGASGNVGTALLRVLGASGSGHELVGISRRPPGSADSVYAGVEWRAMDLASGASAPELRRAVEGADAVVHLAWGLQPTRRPDYLLRLDVGGSARVFDAVRRADVPHLVHFSSIGAYSPGPKGVRVDESFPTEGVLHHPYSRHKVAVERMLDRFEARTPATTVTRVRPTVVLQREAGSAIVRYFLGPLVPASLLRHLPVLPMDPAVEFQTVHADDVADAVARILDRRAGGAFNLASEPALTAADLADALGARLLPVDARVLRAVVAATWHARMQPVDPSWLDLALASPLVDAGRARRELEWEPRTDSRAALLDVLSGMVEGVGTGSEALRPRPSPLGVLRDELPRLLRSGPVGDRRRP